MKQRIYDLRALGFEPAPSADQIETAFKALAMLHHPDRGGDAAKFDELRTARDRLLAAKEAGERCADCLGSGRVLMVDGFSTLKVLCDTCGGSGHA